MELIKTNNIIPPFSDFYNTHYQKVVYYINKKIGNPYDAEDLASEVFVYCYNHYDNYDPQKSSLSTWLYLIVNSRLKNHYRDAKIYVDLESIIGVLPDDSIDLDACIYLQQVRQQLEQAIAKLPKRQQKIVTMRYFENLSHASIASKLGMTEGNVRVQLSRALDALEKMCSNLLEGVK